MASLGYETMVGDAARPSKIRDPKPSVKPRLLRPFGQSGAARYDDDTRGMPRRYHTAHAIQNELVHRSLETAGTSEQVVVDFGCGTANDGLHILSRMQHATYVGIDYSTHMLARAAGKLARAGYKHQSALIKHDFRHLTRDEIFGAIRRNKADRKIRCVISAIALHHYDLQEKKHVYELAFDLLPKGGLLVLTDLYSNAIGHCADWAWTKELVDIRNAVDRLEKRRGRTHRGASTISEWHYREDNRPQILTEEISLLRDTGFRTIEVVYRNGQLGVLAIEK